MKNNICDYVDWRGDLSFIDYPYNEVDYFILSELAYVHLDNILDFSSLSNLSLKDLYILYNQRNESLNQKELTMIYNESHYLFEKMALSLRYQNIKLIHYVNDIDKELIKQFSAMTLLLEDETMVVSYRGTDETLVGWYEDFLMLCEQVVPAQLSAAQYLKEVAKYPYQDSLFQSLKNHNLGSSLLQRFKKHFQLKKARPIILTGHSKGGNLAVYSGCFVDKDIKDKITQIYNYDGPGFHNEIVLSSEYKNMLPRIHSYIPHYSFFGIVLSHDETYSVVHSHNTGMLQHNGFSWDVCKEGFVEDELSYESVQFSIKVIVFLDKLSYEEKRAFVDAMFNLFYALDISTFTELSQISYKQMLSGIKELTLLDPNVRKTLLEVIYMLWLEAKKSKK